MCSYSNIWCCICFFFKQKTAYELRISDWSSDVCSSDLRDDRVIAVGVRIDRDHAVVTGRGQRHPQQGRDRGLADTALAREHRDETRSPGQRSGDPHIELFAGVCLATVAEVDAEIGRAHV